MDTRSDIREFLTSRRARLTPEQAGLRVFGDKRRVPGLRREEVAVLAGVSVPYYTRLERGDMNGVSDGVLDALSRALQLDDAEHEHLFDLARAARPTVAPPRQRRSARPTIRPSIQWLLDSVTGAAVMVQNRHLDVLGANHLGRALYAPMYEADPGRANAARFFFLDPSAPDFFPDWEGIVADCVAALRTEAGRDPRNRALSDLVGELSTQSEPFRKLWATHNVRLHVKGVKRFHHPVVGDLTLSYDRLELPADPDQVVYTYTAEPGTRSREALDLLASWAATPESALRPRL